MEQDAAGKVRVAPHAAGKFACHVYMTSPLPTLESALLPQIAMELNRTTGTIFHIEAEPHLSLSKTFYARHWHLSSLYEKLLKHRPIMPVDPITFDRLALYCNEDRTRSFVALKCTDQSNTALLPWIRAVDDTLVGFGFEPYYEDPSLHCSLLWCNDPLGADLLEHSAFESLRNILPIRWKAPQIYFKGGHQKSRL